MMQNAVVHRSHPAIVRSCNKQQHRGHCLGRRVSEGRTVRRTAALLNAGFLSIGGNPTKSQLPQPDFCQTLRPPARLLAVGPATFNFQRQALRCSPSQIRKTANASPDSPGGAEDPRLDPCDIYMFLGLASRAVMAMTASGDGGGSAPLTFRSEGLYRFRFDPNGDAHEGVAFRVRVGDPTYVRGNARKRVQSLGTRRAGGAEALPVVTQTTQA